MKDHLYSCNLYHYDESKDSRLNVEHETNSNRVCFTNFEFVIFTVIRLLFVTELLFLAIYSKENITIILDVICIYSTMMLKNVLWKQHFSHNFFSAFNLCSTFR